MPLIIRRRTRSSCRPDGLIRYLNNIMKILVVFYSRTGTTKKVAQTILNLLQCDIEEIFDTKNRAGAFGYFLSGRDAKLKKLTVLKYSRKNPALYDLIIIGTPIWFFTISTPVRTYLHQNKDTFKKVAFFCTEGSSGGKKTFREMENLCSQKPLATLELANKEVAKNNFIDKLNNFTDEIKKTIV